MSTHVGVNTFAYSVTFLTNKILVSLQRIVILAGLDARKLVGDWRTLELGIKTWMTSRYLERVILEVFDPKTSELVDRWDFEIEYGYGGDDDGTMWVDPDAIRYAMKKRGLAPSGCDYRIVVTNKEGRSDVVGWSSTTLRSTDGFVWQGVGTAIGANPLSSRLGYYRRAS